MVFCLMSSVFQLTVNVAVHVVLVPPELLAVPTYVVVVVGATETEPLADVSAPTLGLIDPETAFCDVQDSVAELPRVIVFGTTDNAQVTAGGVTVTVPVHVPVPPVPVAVAV